MFPEFLSISVCFLFIPSNCFCRSVTEFGCSRSYLLWLPGSPLLLFFRFVLASTICHSLFLIFPFKLHHSAFILILMWSGVVLAFAYCWVTSISLFNVFILSLAELSSCCQLITSFPAFKQCIQFTFTLHIFVETLLLSCPLHTNKPIVAMIIVVL